MDPALLCEATLGEDETDSEIMLAETEEIEEQESAQNNKRPHPSNGEKSSPTKKMRESFSSRNVKASPHSPSPQMQKAQMQRQRLGTPPGSNARVSAPAKNSQGAQKTPNRAQGGGVVNRSVTWKYKPLRENAYTADIKKSELLKDYEPEKCECKPHVHANCKVQDCGCQPPEENVDGEVKKKVNCGIVGCKEHKNEGCRSGCHNRAIYVECDIDFCSNGENCGNRVIQKMQYAPGLERFMTANKGWGVRARQSVSKGTFILEYTGEIVSQKEFEKRMLSGYIEDEHHYCLALDSKHMIDAHRAGSECRFVNHSCDPNCEMMKWNVKGLYRMALFAKKDILAGTEICYDYNFSLFDSDKGQTCHCGAKECRGIIGGKNKDFAIKIDGQKGGINDLITTTATDPTIQLKIDEKWFNQNVQKEEMDWFKANAPKGQQLVKKQVKCTVCNEQLNHTHVGQIQRHPALGVVMCNDCRKKYSKVIWDKKSEEDGNDDSCRWCTEGEDLFLCDECPSSFCHKCIKWNLGRKFVKQINDAEKWKCLLCDPSPLKASRSLYWAVHQYHKTRQTSKTKNTTPVKYTPTKTTTARKTLPQGSARKSFPTQPQVRSPLVTNGQTPSRGVTKNQPPMKVNFPGPPSGGQRFVHGNKVLTIKNTVVNHRPKQNGLATKQFGRVMVGNGARIESPIPNHWLDKMMKEVEDASNQTMELMSDLRHNWTKGSRGEDDETKITQQVRQVLQIHKKSIDDLDKKMINEYRMNREDADLRDIEPEKIDKLKFNESIIREKEIFSKSSLEVENEGIEGIVCTPEMPVFPSDDEEGGESEPEIVCLESSDDNDSDNDSDSEESESEGDGEIREKGEIKMPKADPEDEDMDESSAELSEVDSAGSDSNELKVNGAAKLDLESKAKDSENEEAVTEGDPDCNEGVNTEAKSNSEFKTEVDSENDEKDKMETKSGEDIKEEKSDGEKLKTEVKSDEEKVKTEEKSGEDIKEEESNGEKLKTEVKSDCEDKGKTEAKSGEDIKEEESDGEKLKSEVQSDNKEKVKIEAKSDEDTEASSEKVNTEVQSDVKENVKPEAKSDGDNVKPEVKSDKTETNSGNDKVKTDLESMIDELNGITKTEFNSQEKEKIELESSKELLDKKVETEEINDKKEKSTNNGADSKLESSDTNLDTEHSECQDSLSKLDNTKEEVASKHKDTEEESKDMDE